MNSQVNSQPVQLAFDFAFPGSARYRGPGTKSFYWNSQHWTLAELAAKRGISHHALWLRLRRGMTIDEAMALPKMSHAARGRKAASMLECRIPSIAIS